MGSDADCEARGPRVGVNDFPAAVLPAEDGGDAEYVRLGRRAVDGRGGVLERHGIGEVAARPASRISFSYAVQFENDAPAGSAR